MKVHIFSLNSSDGWNAVECYCCRTSGAGTGLILFCELSVKGDFWDRQEVETGPIKSDPVADFLATLYQVRIPLKSLVELTKQLPVALQARSHLDILLSDADPQLQILISKRKDFLISAEKAVFSLKFRTQRMNSEWAFVVDITTLSSMHSEIEEALSKLRRQP